MFRTRSCSRDLLEAAHDSAFIASITSAQPVTDLNKLEPTGQNTQVEKSVRSVMEDLQGQRLAGVVVFTDGRDTPTAPLADTLAAVKDFGVKVYPVPVGSEKAAEQHRSAIRQRAGQRVQRRHRQRQSDRSRHGLRTRIIPCTLTLKDKKTGKPLTAPDGSSGRCDATYSLARRQAG